MIALFDGNFGALLLQWEVDVYGIIPWIAWNVSSKGIKHATIFVDMGLQFKSLLLNMNMKKTSQRKSIKFKVLNENCFIHNIEL